MLGAERLGSAADAVDILLASPTAGAGADEALAATGNMFVEALLQRDRAGNAVEVATGSDQPPVGGTAVPTPRTQAVFELLGSMIETKREVAQLLADEGHHRGQLGPENHSGAPCQRIHPILSTQLPHSFRLTITCRSLIVSLNHRASGTTNGTDASRPGTWPSSGASDGACQCRARQAARRC